jgi:hypothetical protein
LSSAPAANGTFSTLFCESFLRCLSPYHGGPTECTCLVLPRRRRPSPRVARVGFPLLPANAIFHGRDFRGCSYSVMFRPPSLLASRIAPTAASFPAGQLRRLRPSRTCVVTFARIGYAARGLPPRKTHSIVDCSLLLSRKDSSSSASCRLSRRTNIAIALKIPIPGE